MKAAYRIPNGKFPIVEHFLSQMTAINEPITEMVVNSVIAAPSENQQVRVGQPVEIGGVAWDGGYGVRRIDVSADSGVSWQAATLTGSRALRVPHLDLPLHAEDAWKTYGRGESEQCHRPDP